jgi:hypothetical protein
LACTSPPVLLTLIPGSLQTDGKIWRYRSGAGSDDIPKILAATINLPAQVITGYKGTAETRLASTTAKSKPLANWESTKSTWRNELDSGTLKVGPASDAQISSELKQIPVALI